MNTPTKEKGFALPAVIAIIVVVMIFLPVLMNWVHQDTRFSVITQKSTTAFNLAEAGVDRGLWKLKSSTGVFSDAVNGVTISGYNFDVTYDDITGGFYRIRFVPGPNSRQVTIIGEGRDRTSNDVRAVKAIFQNQTFPGAMITGGIITWANAFSAHWGPIMAHNNINITDANAAQDYFPRKYSRQVVECTAGKSYPRDTNGLNPPNTDNLEWWSDYPVPELPILNFGLLRSSAAATGTLNVFGCSKMSSYSGTKWWGKNACNLGGKNHDGTKHFQNSYNHPSARKQYVWYWDGDVIMTGSTGDEGHGIWGNVVVRGDLTNYAGDNYYYTGHVPEDAWMEYAKITKTTGDTSKSNQYPADDGYQKNRSTFKFGGETWTDGHSPPSSGNTDVGIRGLLYIGGDFNIEGPCDINGAVWVVGNVSKAVGSERTIVFFDDTLDVPSLNVVLVRKSWQEISPSTTTWP